MGVVWDLVVSLAVEMFPPKPHWTEAQVPDLTGRVILVTGGNSGLGFETAKELARHGATVYLASRNKSKGEEAVQAIEQETGKTPRLLELDLADLDSVETAVKTFLSKERRLDVLYNSAGIMIPSLSETTKQGYDLQFGIVLGHFYLTKLLLPLLESTAQSTGGKARVISVSSGAHHFSGLNFATFKDGPERLKKSTEGLYAQSKYAVVVFAAELARRYGDKGIVSIGMNPGNIKTNMQRNVHGFSRTIANMFLTNIKPYGIVTYLWAGTAEETADYNGKFLIPWARIGKPRADSQNPEIGKELWTWMEEQVQGRSL